MMDGLRIIYQRCRQRGTRWRLVDEGVGLFSKIDSGGVHEPPVDLAGSGSTAWIYGISAAISTHIPYILRYIVLTVI